MRTIRFHRFLFLLCLSVLWLAAFPASGEETARDITAQCRLTAGSHKNKLSRCTDRDYETYWASNSGNAAWIEVSIPDGASASGVWLQWYDHTHPWAVQLPNAEGGWDLWQQTDGSFLSEFLPLPEGTVRFRITNPPGLSRRFMLAELRIYSAGVLPGEVQRWSAPAEKADLMLLVAHPDDEVLWFGGTLPTYAGDRGKTCQICMFVQSTPHRRLELLDCLWTCGVRNYPVWGGLRDSFSGTLKKQYTYWGKNKIYEMVTEWIRRFRPDVLLTQDINGEYGHGAHRVCADSAIKALDYAADAKKYKSSAKTYGTWDVPKCYIHLYTEGEIIMDWRQPLAAFGGATGFDVAEAAFRCHVSQQSTRYRVEDFGSCDCRRFGLYRSLVGPDEAKDDFFEHIQAQ